MIIGYAIEGAKNFVIDVNSVNVKNFKKVYRTNTDYQKIESYLSIQEKKVVNQSEVYEVILNDTTYFHIKDLEDDDFIGMDYEKNMFKITHDPFEITPINLTLFEVCQLD
jgi:hypothetical protein